MPANNWIRVGALLLFIAGLAIPWWPLAFIAPLMLALYGYWLIGLVCALLADLFFGAPVGIISMLVFPCVIATVLCSITRNALIRHLR